MSQFRASISLTELEQQFGRARVLIAYRFPHRDAITEYLAVYYKLPADEARRRAAFLPSPLALTKRGVYVWAKNRIAA